MSVLRLRGRAGFFTQFFTPTHSLNTATSCFGARGMSYSAKPLAGSSSVEAETPIAWVATGHELLGMRCARQFGKRCALGTITKWVDADEAEGDPALFHVEHNDTNK